MYTATKTELLGLSVKDDLPALQRAAKRWSGLKIVLDHEALHQDMVNKLL